MVTSKDSPNPAFGHTRAPNDRASFARNTLLVTSGKGGVGKSTVAVNLASALAQRDFRVGLLDADVFGPSIPRLLQVREERVRWNEDNKMVPSENFGIRIMSVGLTLPEADTPLLWRSSVATSALIQLLEDVAWGELDFLIIDMPPGTGDIQLTLLQEVVVRGAVVVTTPQLVATDDVARLVRMLQEVNTPITGLIENMSHFVAPDTGRSYEIFGPSRGAAFAETYGIPFLGSIPLHMDIARHSDAGFPAALASGTLEGDSIRAAYRGIADRILTCIP